MTKIVAVTNCPAGIAHTYMVAEAIETEAKKRGFEVHVETQGASGVEDKLTPEQIEKADYVILALGKGLTEEDKNRFNGKKIIELPVSDALRNVEGLMDHLESKAHVYKKTKVDLGGDEMVEKTGIMSHLMAGVSAALPFVIAGGLLMAIGSILVQFGVKSIPPTSGHLASISWILNTVGGLGFTFMIPIMGAYIANSIGDKPALAPAFIASYLANTPDLLGTKTGAGFLGSVILGLLIGYFVKWLKKINIGKTLQSTVSFLIVPLVTSLIFGLLTYYILGPITASLMGSLIAMLNAIPTSMKIIGGFIVGCMLSFDMGGPVNKAAWFFAFSLLSSHVYTWYGVVGVVTCLPPMAAAISCWLRPKLFTKQERDSSISAFIIGATVATEPAIPYALAAPVPMIAANTLSGGIAGACAMLLNVERTAPGLNLFDPILGLARPWMGFYISVAIGLICNVAFIIILKSMWLKRKEKELSE